MFKRLKGALAAGGVGFFLISGVGLADETLHSQVKSTDGTVIQVDYQQEIFRDGYVIATPLWIHALNSRLRPGDRVRVVLMTYDAGRLEQFETVDLYYSEPGRYEGLLRGGLVIGHEEDHFRQELACVVNGGWLSDPINGTSNFQLTLLKR